VLVDIDHFKAVNDSLGHERGDTVLAAVAATLADAQRTEDVLARLGGDEFALLMPRPTSSRRSTPSSGRGARSPRFALEGGLSVSVSAGICGVEHAQDADTLVRLADGALYWSKAHGRDAACVYDVDVVRELSISERADQLQRSRRSWASARWRAPSTPRTVDARALQRVAELACAIARRPAVARGPHRAARGGSPRPRRRQDRRPRRGAAEARSPHR